MILHPGKILASLHLAALTPYVALLVKHRLVLACLNSLDHLLTVVLNALLTASAASIKHVSTTSVPTPVLELVAAMQSVE